MDRPRADRAAPAQDHWGMGDDSITDLLKHDHRKIKQLYEQTRAAKSNKQRTRLLHELEKEVHIHGQIEKEIYYPVVPAAEPVPAGLVRSAEEHEAFEVLSGKELLDAEQIVFHHMQEEEETVMPEASRVLDNDEERERLLRGEYRRIRLMRDVQEIVERAKAALQEVADSRAYISWSEPVADARSVQLVLSYTDPAVYSQLPVFYSVIKQTLLASLSKGLTATVIVFHDRTLAAFTSTTNRASFLLQTDDFDPERTTSGESLTGARVLPFNTLKSELGRIGARTTASLVDVLASSMDEMSDMNSDLLKMLENAIARFRRGDRLEAEKDIMAAMSEISRHDEVNMAPAEKRIKAGLENLEAEERQAIGSAFANYMMKDMPPELTDLRELFEAAPSQDAMSLLNHEDVVAAQDHGIALAERGLTPCMVAEACHAIARRLRRFHLMEQCGMDTEVNIGALPDDRANAYLSKEDLVREVANSLRVRLPAAAKLVEWLLAVAAVKPLIFNGFECHARGRTLAAKKVQQRRVAAAEIWQSRAMH